METAIKLENRLPESHEEYTDKYFLRSREILKKEGLNPWTKMQVFVRKGPGNIHGIDEAVEIVDRYSDLRKNGGHVYALPEGDSYEGSETVMVIEGPLQDMIELETMYLGVIAAETSKANDGTSIDLKAVEEHAGEVVELSKKPVMYFGARHWRYDEDKDIAEAAYKGGCVACSTDIGAEAQGQKGLGTIPHALVLAFAEKYGMENATVEAAKAFDRHMPESIPRVVLVDTFNKEITDTIATAEALEGRLSAIRIDTCGENVGEGCTRDGKNLSYETGTGVTIELARNLRQALDNAGHNNVDIILSSGFGNTNKVNAFVEDEQQNGRLFDSLGVGGFFTARYATADIVELDHKPMSKTGRGYRPNPRLEQVF